MGIKLINTALPKTRTTTVKLILWNPETESFYEEETPFEYFSDTLENAKERFKNKNIKADDAAAALAARIKCFPEVIDDEGNPVEITSEFISKLHAENLNRISTAMRVDMNPNADDSPKKSPSDSSQDT